MSVWKIAAGVFLGNLLFGLLAWAVVSIEMAGVRQQAAVDSTDAAYNAMLARRALSNDVDAGR